MRMQILLTMLFKLSSIRSLSPQCVPAASQPCSGTHVIACTSLDEIKAFEGAWQDLADNAATPNVFLEPWHFLPSFVAYGPQKKSLVIFVFQDTVGPRRTRQLIGFIPMELDSPDAWLPGPVLSSWRHPNLLLCTPLLRRSFETETWAAFFDWVRASPHRNRVLEISRLLGEGPCYQALTDHLHANAILMALIEQSARAQLERDAASPDTPLDDLSPGARKELRRQRRRLGEQGILEFRVLRANEPPHPWIDQFLELEAAGWKREAGSAMSCHEHTESYFRSICLEGHKRGKLQMLGLFLDGRPVALKCNFVTGDTGFTLKIAYDERYKAYSPGVLLELDMIEHFRNDDRLVRVDSCAIAQHPMINRLWRHQRPMVIIAISTGAIWSSLYLKGYTLLRSIKRSLQSAGRR
jgi:CelD/BcsL family acetyltransferase involved in cellulose biosynthesis